MHQLNKRVYSICNFQYNYFTLLDIQLRGETGFDLFKFLDNPTSIIFVTAYEKNAISHFEGEVIDYLTKPINPDRLKAAIEMVLRLSIHPEKRNQELCLQML